MGNNAVVLATVAALLRGRNDSLLLVQRPHEPFASKWALPGGHIDPGETAAEAIRREVKEETGLELSDTHVLGSRDEIAPEHDWFAVVQIFSGEVTGELSPREGEGKAAWFSVDKAMALPLAFGHKDIIRDFQEGRTR